MAELTLAQLRERLNYCPKRGVFTHVFSRPGGIKPGDRADRPLNRGYRQITVRPHRYLAHRLAWLFVHGAWPKDQIDHIDGDPSNNRIKNLREATASQNQANRKKIRRPHHLRGVRKVGNRWRAEIGFNGGMIHIGHFDTSDEARAAYDAKSIELFLSHAAAYARAA